MCDIPKAVGTKTHIFTEDEDGNERAISAAPVFGSRSVTTDGDVTITTNFKPSWAILIGKSEKSGSFRGVSIGITNGSYQYSISANFTNDGLLSSVAYSVAKCISSIGFMASAAFNDTNCVFTFSISTDYTGNVMYAIFP